MQSGSALAEAEETLQVAAPSSPPTAPEPTPQTPARRLLSLDLLRGLVVLLMLFVNQADWIEGAPSFLHHAGEDADVVTLADLVLPAFLFMVGMSIPFALGGRLRREGIAPTARRVLARSAALLAMGVLIENAGYARPGGVLSPPVWGVLAVVGAILAWQARPPEPERRRTWLLTRSGGAVLLVFLVLVYRGSDASGFVQIRPHGWGILGSIGWAYLTAALVYLVARDRPAPLLVLVAALNGLYYLDVLLEPAWTMVVRPYLGVGGLLGSQGGVALAGVALGVIASRRARENASFQLALRQGLALAAALLGAGALLHLGHAHHVAFTYNKGDATPPWGLVSAGTTAVAWLALFAVADGIPWRRWPPLLRIAGENALLVYLLEPLALALLATSALVFGRNPWEYLLERGTASALLAAALFACLVGRLAGLLARAGVRLRL